MGSVPWYKMKTCRLSSMLALTFSFFLVEIIVGYITNSLALIGDSYHMLSDVLALIIGLLSLRMSKKSSVKNTYGWARSEVLGALVNSVFLLALCFTIFHEAITRLTETHEIQNVDLLLYVGIAGLVVNVIGLLLFHGTGHGHSHGGHAHQPDAEQTTDETGQSETTSDATNAVVSGEVNDADVESVEPQSAESGSTDPQASAEPDRHSHDDDVSTKNKRKQKKTESGAQLNMRAVFVHVMGDALGSVVVIISALLIKFIDDSQQWKYKIDPALSLVLVGIICFTTIPLLKESSLILMQTVPTHIEVAQLTNRLLEEVEGIYAIHEFHVWQLAGNRIIASAHIRCVNLRDHMRIAEQVKTFFHNHGIHSTTIQLEFVEFEELSSEDRVCVLECGPDKTCYPDTCCARNKALPTSESDLTGDEGLRQRGKWTSSEDNSSAAIAGHDGPFTDIIVSTDFRSSVDVDTADTRA